MPAYQNVPEFDSSEKYHQKAVGCEQHAQHAVAFYGGSSRQDVRRRMVTEIPRGTVIGRRIGGRPTDEAEHFFKFEMCGGWFDMRDLGAVLEHEEPLPLPARDQVL